LCCSFFKLCFYVVNCVVLLLIVLLLLLILLFYILFVCKLLPLVSTQLQLTNISYHTFLFLPTQLQQFSFSYYRVSFLFRKPFKMLLTVSPIFVSTTSLLLPFSATFAAVVWSPLVHKPMLQYFDTYCTYSLVGESQETQL
jgi:hypothetical protein